MATTDTMFILEPFAMVPPATLFATLDTVADTSTPVGHTPVLDFVDGTDKWAYWFVTCPSNYAGGGFTVSWKGGTDNTSVGTLELPFPKLLDNVSPVCVYCEGDIEFSSLSADRSVT